MYLGGILGVSSQVTPAGYRRFRDGGLLLAHLVDFLWLLISHHLSDQVTTMTQTTGTQAMQSLFQTGP